jgi:hypothetical protein
MGSIVLTCVDDEKDPLSYLSMFCLLLLPYSSTKGLAEAFPESGLQIGLWLNGDQGCRDIMSGLLDENMYQLFDFIQSDLPESLPKVFLRVGYEFDNPSFGYSGNPSSYQDAFRKLVRTCENQMKYNICHEKIAFVWHSWAAPRQINTSLVQFYPGDDFVDWVGVSIFQQLYPWANNNDDDDRKEDGGDFAGGNILEVEEVLDFAKSRKKPIMIAESTPFGGMDVLESNNISKRYLEHSNNSSSSSSSNDIWNIWFQKTIDIINKYDISMWSYINCDWDSQPMWKGIGFGDTRLSSSEDVMNHWWDQILNNDNNNDNDNDNSTSRFLFRIENCDDSELHDPTATVVETDARTKYNKGDSIYPQGIHDVVPSSALLSKLVVGTGSMPSNNNWRTNSFTSLLSGKLSCLLSVGGLAVFLLLRLVHKTKQRCYHRVERPSQPACDTCIIHANNNNNDDFQRSYGSFEMKISNGPKKLQFAL